MFAEARLYQDYSFCQRKESKDMISAYKDKLRWKNDECILDVGCGSGIMTDHISQLFPNYCSRIIGVDSSDNMIIHARNNYKNSKMSFYKMDISESHPNDLRQFLPTELKETKFDKIFCFHVLHWLADKFQQGVCNLGSLLAKGGQGMAINYISVQVFDTYTVVGKYAKWAPYLKGIILDFNPLRLRADPCAFMEKCFIEAGLEVEDISEESHNNIYKSIPELMGLIKSIDPFLQHIPPELHAEYLDDFCSALLKRSIVSSSGSVMLPVTVMRCLFTKK